MKKNLLILLSCAAVGSAAWAQPAPQVDSFRYRNQITLSGSGPFHQLQLPLRVYQGVQRADLGDLRVFNERGEVVPHALLRPHTPAAPQIRETAVPFFPILTSREGSGDLSVDVKRNTDGTLISVRQSSALPGGQLVSGAILDASRIRGGGAQGGGGDGVHASGVRSLRLEVGPSSVPFHPFTIETSDDLQQWRLLKKDAQLVQLDHAGQRIVRNSVEWDADAGKYLRLLWAAPTHAPSITATMLGARPAPTDQPPMLWTDPIASNKIEQNTFDYTLPGHMPLERLRIGLPQSNTLAPIQIQQYIAAEPHRKLHRPLHVQSHRNKERGERWQTITRTVAFRLQSPQGDVRSPDIVLNWPAVDRLRLAVDGRSGGLGSTAPTLQVGFVPQVLVFLPRGDGPFSLAWGAAAVTTAALPAATLIPGYRSDQKLSASPATLQMTADQSGAPSAPATVKAKTVSKAALWGVLIAGLLVLAGMVWVLVKQMKQKETASAPRES